MKPGMFGCIVGSAAALVLSGCAEDEVRYSAATYDSGYYATEPTFVERRVVVIDNQRRTVPIYRTGDAHFYTWGGRRYTLGDYPHVAHRGVVGAPGYRDIGYRGIGDRGIDRVGYRDERRQVRRSARRFDRRF